jgi:hypothetical protein
VITFLVTTSLRLDGHELLLSITDESFTHLMSLEVEVVVKLIG